MAVGRQGPAWPQACLPHSPEMQKGEAPLQAADWPSLKGESLNHGFSLPPLLLKAPPSQEAFPCNSAFSNSLFHGSQIHLVWFVMIASSRKAQLFSCRSTW